MSYMHIKNLYKNALILLFRECIAMEKIHGTSAHVSFSPDGVTFSSGGASRDAFLALFDLEALAMRYAEVFPGSTIVVYGEVYGGKMQKMSDIYGPNLRFVAFEVKIGDKFLNVAKAHQIADSFGFEFVHYKQIPCTLEMLDAERDADSVQAVRNGCGLGHPREGIVIRPLAELLTNNGERIIAKYKREEFRETKGPRLVTDEKLAVLAEAQAIADEWVTEERMTHVLNAFPEPSPEDTGKVISVMIEDVERESIGEIVISRESKKAIGTATAQMFKRRLALR